MSMQRITVSLPEHIYNNLVQIVPQRGISGFVSRAVENSLMEEDLDNIQEFVNLRKKLPRKRAKDIIKAIKKDRV